MVITHNEKSIRLPDIFLVGAAKSGTTTISSILDQHPQISIPRKEPGFFSHMNKKWNDIDAVNRDRQVTEIEDYIELYKKVRKGDLIADCSVRYLVTHEDTIRNIKEVYGELSQDLQIIIILRNPIDRAFSHYNMLLKNGFEDLSFEEAILPINSERRRQQRLGFDYLNHGLYYDQVKAYKENFENVKVYAFEELKETEKLSKDLFQYLKLKPLTKLDGSISLNPSGIPKHKWLIKLVRGDSFLKHFLKKHFFAKHKHLMLKVKSKLIRFSVRKNTMNLETRNDLRDFYRKDIELLQELIGVDLSHWSN